MIIYKNDSGSWRIPRSIIKNNAGTWDYQTTVRRKNGSAWDINWHRNSSSFATINNVHPFWLYSMNPYFNISENNYYGLNGELEITYDTGLSNPNSSGRYTSGLGVGTIYATQKSSANACDCILKSKFPLNIVAGSKYRSKIVINSRTPSNETFGILPARYYRLLIDKVRDGAAANSVQLSEFRLFDINGNTLSATYSSTGGNSPSGEDPTKAGDGLLTTKWLDFNETSAILNITFASNTAIAGYRWATANDATERDPVSWRLQASTNNSTWTTIATVTDWATSTTRQNWEPDFFLQPTILTGYWSSDTYDGADFKGSGAVSVWGPRVDFGRTTSLSTSGTWNWGTGNTGVWSLDYFVTTKTLSYDTTFPSSHTWIRPIIKIESQSTNAVPVNYQLASWEIIRVT